MKYLILIFLVFSGLQVQAQLSPVAQDTFPWFVNYRLPTRVVGTKAPSSIFLMDSTQTKLRAVPVDSIADYIGTAGVVGYQEYVAFLTQTGTDAPVATVLSNNLSGPIVWTYVGVGSYLGTLASAFPTTTAIIPQYSSPEVLAADGDRVRILRASANTVTIDTYTGGVVANAVLSGFLVTIRVYN